MKLVFTSDWHIRSDQPICRSDNFWDIQEKTLKQINEIASKNNASIINAGDIFHRSNPKKSQELEILLSVIFKNMIYYIAGNHDLKNGSIDNFEKGSIGVLNSFPKWFHYNFIYTSLINILFFDYGIDLTNNFNENIMCVFHQYCELEKLPNYIENGITAKELLNKYNYDVFF